MVQELLELGFPVSFNVCGTLGPFEDIMAQTLIAGDEQLMLLLLRYGDGRELTPALMSLVNVFVADGTRTKARILALSKMVARAATTMHPGKVRRALLHLRRIARIVGRMSKFWMNLFNEVHLRPGGEGEKVAKNSFLEASGQA